MNLLDLPKELFQAILVESVIARGLQRGLRLRLVNKRFDVETHQAIFTSRLADQSSYSCESTFWSSYLKYRVLAKDHYKFPYLKLVRVLASQLLSEDERDCDCDDALNSNIERLCQLSLFAGFEVKRLSDTESTSDYDHFPQQRHLLVAAAWTNLYSLTKHLVEDEVSDGHSSEIFGYAVTAAAAQGNAAVVELLLSRPRRSPNEEQQRQVCRGVAKGGNLNVLNILLRDIEPAKGRWLRMAFLFRDLLLGLESRNIAVIERIVEYVSPNRLEFLDNYLGRILYRSALHGHFDVTKHYIQKVNPTNHQSQKNLQNCLRMACSKGYIEIVELLLAHGADVNPQDTHSAEPLAYAVASGHIGIAKILLDHGANANYRHTSLIVHAIRLEHIDMYMLLRNHGALSSTTDSRGVALNLAQEYGLDSMVKLLLNEGKEIEIAANDERRHGHDSTT